MNITTQIAKAILRGDKTFKSTSGMYDVKLPSPQTAGTYTQREAYAYMEAQKIVNLKVHDLWPRLCDYTNKGMWRGFSNNDTYVSPDGKKAFMDDWKLPSMNDAWESYDFYYTEWEELEDDENFTSSGALIEMTDEIKSYLK